MAEQDDPFAHFIRLAETITTSAKELIPPLIEQLKTIEPYIRFADAWIQENPDFYKDICSPNGHKITDIVLHRYFYERSNNHNLLHAWAAIDVARNCQFHQLPEWAVNAITQNSAAILDLPVDSDQQQSAIRAALGLTVKHITDFREWRAELEIYHQIYYLHIGGKSLEDAYYDLAEQTNASHSTMKRLYKKFKDVFEGERLVNPFGP